jgi:2-amino-4-hydroxy-6-hydroxymethyldihydropteridine diphosphokinase
MESAVFIALGSNQGDRERHLLLGVAEVGKLPGTKIAALSSFYDTESVGPVRQGDFLNAVARLETTLSPQELLRQLQQIETGIFQRKREVPNGPRPMDLDILFYGSLILHEPGLIIPHPRLHERRFVLEPLAEIAPDFIHPGLQRNVKALLRSVKTTERVTKI